MLKAEKVRTNLTWCLTLNGSWQPGVIDWVDIDAHTKFTCWAPKPHGKGHQVGVLWGRWLGCEAHLTDKIPWRSLPPFLPQQSGKRPSINKEVGPQQTPSLPAPWAGTLPSAICWWHDCHSRVSAWSWNWGPSVFGDNSHIGNVTLSSPSCNEFGLGNWSWKTDRELKQVPWSS